MQELLILAMTRVQSFQSQVKILKRYFVIQRPQADSLQVESGPYILLYGQHNVLNIRRYYIERILTPGFS